MQATVNASISMHSLEQEKNKPTQQIEATIQYEVTLSDEEICEEYDRRLLETIGLRFTPFFYVRID